MECYTEGAKGGGEGSVNLLTIAMKGVDSVLMRVVGGGNYMLKCFKDSGRRFR